MMKRFFFEILFHSFKTNLLRSNKVSGQERFLDNKKSCPAGRFYHQRTNRISFLMLYHLKFLICWRFFQSFVMQTNEKNLEREMNHFMGQFGMFIIEIITSRTRISTMIQSNIFHHHEFLFFQRCCYSPFNATKRNSNPTKLLFRLLIKLFSCTSFVEN